MLATGQGRLAAAGEWVLSEKRLTERAGLHAIQDRLAQPWSDLDALVSVWLLAGRAAPGANSGTVRVLPIARVARAVLSSAKSSV